MRYVCLACDFDGTLASDGVVPDDVVQALTRVAASGRSLILVTGRRLEDLFSVFNHVDLFDYVVSENGALLYKPSTRVARALAEPPPRNFIDALRENAITPEIGKVAIATWHPNESKVLEIVQELGLDMHISFNKGAVMILPPGVNKGSGLEAALFEMGLSTHNVVGIGDAENDLSMLAVCECSVAVGNAIPSIKDYADITVRQDHGKGVMELIDRLLDNDLNDCARQSKRHNILLGHDASGVRVCYPSHDFRILIAGPSQSGKSTVTMSVLKQFASAGYQYCVIDPEGEYDRAPRSVTIGNEHYVPEVDDVVRVLANPCDNAVVNLLGVPLNERAGFLARMFAAVQNMRRVNGRPHWLVIDEAHHMLHPYWDQTFEPVWHEPGAIVTVTVDPCEISKTVLASMDLVIAIGRDPQRTLGTFAGVVEQHLPETVIIPLGWGEALAWFRHESRLPCKVGMVSSPLKQQRHLRKYAEGNLGSQRSFYFTGPAGRLNIRCQNLIFFMQVAEGIDEETWLYHLRRGDYSSWFRNVIADECLAADTQRLEQNHELSANESRSSIKSLIERRYTLPVPLMV
ncbi:MAG: HAD-IIB family hydrolase [Candidatus Melainabacteria bacterium]|nr:HAD-IIB family hydrolase [Candidatus Melainabacteria bacterium]